MADISGFVNQYQAVAQKVGATLGVDPNILLGQWGLETGWGKHAIPGTNNLGNIKAKPGQGVTATDNQNGSVDQYRQYNSPDEFGNDFANLIASRYPDATGAGDDALAYAMAVKNGGYAEDPHYVPKLAAAVDTVRNQGGVIDPSKVQWDDGGAAPSQQAGNIDPSQIKWDDAAPATPAKTATPTAPAAAKPKTAREKLAEALTNGPTDQLTGGMLHGVTNTVGGAIQHGAHGIGWLLNKAGFPQADQAVTNAGDQAAQFLTQGTPETPLGIAGQVVGGAMLPGAAGGGILRNAAAAGAIGGLQPVQPGQDFAQQTVKNTLVGGALGGAGTLAGNLVRGATPEANALLRAGVDVTPGQGFGGLARKTEELSRSIPGFGDAVTAAERSNIRSYNRMLYQDALAPIGATLPRDVQTGSAAVDHVRDAIGDRFNQLAANASFTPRGQFIRDVDAIRADLAQRAPAVANQFESVLQNQIEAKLRNGTMNGSQWNDSRSYISGLSRENRLGDVDANQRAFADAMDDLNEAMNQQVARQSTNPNFRQDLTAANNAYARYKRIEGAAGSGGASNNGNVFSPAQYAASVRKGSTNFQRATNTGLNGQVASNAQQVLGAHYPDSGTAARVMLGAALGGGLHFINPAAAASAAAGSLAYATPAGRRAMSLLLLQRPDLVRALGLGGAAVAPGAGVLAPQLAPAQPNQ